MTRIVYINPNATQAMTDDIVATARAVLPGAEVVGLTNSAGPPAIEGPEDGDAAIPGVLALVRGAAAGADAIVIACFDDTGLDEARAAASCPVLGIGQAAYVMTALLGLRFSVVTSVDVAVPVIQGNIERSGFAGLCASVRASGLAVLDIEAGSEAVRARLASEIALARDGDGAAAVVLGCAGMTGLRDDLAARTGVVLIDGVVASARLSVAAAGLAGGGA
ncbi:aspartate/glutamate racemase family protein [Salipiger sp.]|uniref:aspartate/glutamate racemase family protein n=1 Tax=Salipiger sp. TaxID=2078585 RepID=UPI003A973AA0